MASRVPIHPGSVDWSGENPGMYLKETADGRFTTLASFFRVVLSPHGRGHALVLLEAPWLDVNIPEALNVCVTDNEPLARWLVAEFVTRFGAFRGVPALGSLQYRRLTGTAVSGDQRSSYVEWVKGEGVDVTLTWSGLGTPFMVEMPVEKSATGRHEMFSLFVEATTATLLINGRKAVGRPFPRDFAGRQSSTAFLAFSETWVRPSA
jgi:hypothetical protein